MVPPLGRPPEAPLEVSPENSGFESPKMAKCLWRSKHTFIICARRKYCGFHIRLAFLFWKPFKFPGQIVSPFQLLTTAHSTTDTSQLHVILDHLLASMQIFVNTSTLKVKSSEYQQCESPNQQHLIFSYNGSSPFPILVHPPPSPLSLVVCRSSSGCPCLRSNHQKCHQ